MLAAMQSLIRESDDMKRKLDALPETKSAIEVQPPLDVLPEERTLADFEVWKMKLWYGKSGKYEDLPGNTPLPAHEFDRGTMINQDMELLVRRRNMDPTDILPSPYFGTSASAVKQARKASRLLSSSGIQEREAGEQFEVAGGDDTRSSDLLCRMLKKQIGTRCKGKPC